MHRGAAQQLCIFECAAEARSPDATKRPAGSAATDSTPEVWPCMVRVTRISGKDSTSTCSRFGKGWMARVHVHDRQLEEGVG